jgi:cytochrome P450
MTDSSPEKASAPLLVTTWAGAREVFRCKTLRQGLYDDAGLLMHDVIVNLHGVRHRDRRRVENRLFRRDTFRWYDAQVIPALIADAVDEAIASGSGSVDLLPLARRTMMKLACTIAGLDVGDDEFDSVFALMNRLARAATVFHATVDHDALRADGLDALATVDERFVQPSLRRRVDVVSAFERGDLEESMLSRDVLTTLLLHQDDLGLPLDVVIRETAYFPWVGSHSTANAFVHAMNHLLLWFDAHPAQVEALTSDPLAVQRFVHESLRLHPASPQTHRLGTAEPSTVAGVSIAEGRRVIVDMERANQDPSVWGGDASIFNPFREVPGDAAPWGLTFGYGVHACLGMELAGGIAPEPRADGTVNPSTHVYGAIATMASMLLARGVRPDPNRPAEVDTSTIRSVFASYPVVFDAHSVASDADR